MPHPDDSSSQSPSSEPSLNELKQLKEWPAIERYVNTRLRGGGSRIRQLEEQLAKSAEFEAERAELELLRSERVAREQQLSDENEKLFAALPPNAQACVSDNLSVEQRNDLLRRLESQVVDRTVPVFGAGGVRMGQPDAAQLAADRAKHAGHRFLFGSRTKKGGR